MADRLQRLGLSRLWATVLITLIFFLIAPMLVALLAPIIGDQVSSFAQRVPSYVQSLAHAADPIWGALKKSLSPKDIEEIRSAASDYAGTVAGWAGSLAKDVVGSSLAVANALSLLFITPFVTFYLLRDLAPRHRVGRWLAAATPCRDDPRAAARDQSYPGGFCARSSAGLPDLGRDLRRRPDFGWARSRLGGRYRRGFLSFIPYVGSISGFVVSIAFGCRQAHGWALPAEVAGVYAIGNQIEANFLAPRLVGSKIGSIPSGSSSPCWRVVRCSGSSD